MYNARGAVFTQPPCLVFQPIKDRTSGRVLVAATLSQVYRIYKFGTLALPPAPQLITLARESLMTMQSFWNSAGTSTGHPYMYMQQTAPIVRDVTQIETLTPFTPCLQEVVLEPGDYTLNFQTAGLGAGEFVIWGIQIAPGGLYD